MQEKIVGYLLLALGLGIIAYSFFSVYNVFTGQQKPIQLFMFDGISVDLNQNLNVSLPEELQQAGINVEKEKIPQQEIIGPEILNETSNFFAHIILYGFVVNIGFKIASLGTQLVRPIIVNTSSSMTFKKQKSPPLEQNTRLA